MTKLFFKYLWHISSRNFLQSIVFLIITVTLNMIINVITFDTSILFDTYGSWANMPTKEYQVFYPLYNNGLMGLQGYIFGFCFFSLFLVVYLFIFVYLFKRISEKDVVLLKIKNIENAYVNNVYSIGILLTNFLELILCIGLTYLTSYIGNNILNIRIPLLVVGYPTYINSLVIYLAKIIFSMYQIKKITASENVLKVIRGYF